jgi:hypothetical protein
MSKLIIPRENLPDVDIFTNTIRLRFRIITDDRNVSSYWSPVYSVDPGLDFIPNGEVVIEKHSVYSAIIWNPVLVEKNGNEIRELEYYDLWVRWGTDKSLGEWEYKERVASTSINLIKPTSPSGINHLSVEIYRPGKPIIRKRMVDVFQNNTWINTSTDVISFPVNHEFATGDNITYNSSNPVGGLSNGAEYYSRFISSNSITLHPTANDARNNTNKINITSNKNEVGFFTYTGCTVCDFLLYSSYNFSPV